MFLLLNRIWCIVKHNGYLLRDENREGGKEGKKEGRKGARGGGERKRKKGRKEGGVEGVKSTYLMDEDMVGASYRC